MESVFAILIKSLFSLISLNIWESPKSNTQTIPTPSFQPDYTMQKIRVMHRENQIYHF